MTSSSAGILPAPPSAWSGRIRRTSLAHPCQCDFLVTRNRSLFGRVDEASIAYGDVAEVGAAGGWWVIHRSRERGYRLALVLVRSPCAVQHGCYEEGAGTGCSGAHVGPHLRPHPRPRPSREVSSPPTRHWQSSRHIRRSRGTSFMRCTGTGDPPHPCGRALPRAPWTTIVTGPSQAGSRAAARVAESDEQHPASLGTVEHTPGPCSAAHTHSSPATVPGLCVACTLTGVGRMHGVR